MADPMTHLLVTRRLVPLDRHDEYMAAWANVRTAVTHSGGRAWIFRGSEHQDQFLEFVEWHGADAAPALPEIDQVAQARQSVDEIFGAGHSDEWEEPPALRE
jgi:hypothetical protein